MKTRLLVAAALLAAAAAAQNAAPPPPDPTAQKFAEFEQRIAKGEQDKLAAYQELYAFVQAAMKAAEGTPGHEAVNYLRTGDWNRVMDELKQGKRPSDWHMMVIKDNTAKGLLGATWPKPPDVKVPYAKVAPKIDGKLDDAVWQYAATFKDTYAFNSTSPTTECPTTWKIAWDDKYLYFAFDCVDTDIISPKIERDGNVFFNDCVEMFILPDFRYRTYWELVIGPSGSIYDSLQCKNYYEWGCNSKPSENIEGLQVGITIDGHLNQSDGKDKGYTVEVAVPFDQLPGYSRAKPAAGQTLNFMLVRLDKTKLPDKDKDGKDQFSHKAYAFCPLLNWGHNIWNHAKMTLVKE